jgi:SAM-dependent methyltransferase
MEDPKHRFTDRVDDYQKYRPTYPPEVISFIRENTGVDRTWTVADVGSGTGISARLLSWGLKCSILAVEPNGKMRAAAVEAEKDNPFFTSIDGSAERTTLDDSSVNIVCSFQSFHWFNRTAAREEFRRILKEPKWGLLVWNDRMIDNNGFSQDYDSMLREFDSYRTSTHKSIALADIQEFFGNCEIRQSEYEKIQVLDWAALKGRFSSSSYTPKSGTPEYDQAIRRLRELFDKHKHFEAIEFKYDTRLFLGCIT